MKARRITDSDAYNLDAFQPSPVRGRERRASPATRSPSHFNPRARTGRDHRRPPWPRSRSSFNPRARGWARLNLQVHKVVVSRVSIHVPVKGATLRRVLMQRAQQVSTHAREGRRPNPIPLSFAASFQPTRPVKSATASHSSPTVCGRGFDPRARERRDSTAARRNVINWYLTRTP